MLGRAASAAVLIFAVSSASLLLARLAPADDAFGTDPAVLAAERHRLGFDRPLAAQYADWVAHSARFDFGESLRFRRPVATLIRERVGNTALLGLSALALATLIRLPLGVFTGRPPPRGPGAAAGGALMTLLFVAPLGAALVPLL